MAPGTGREGEWQTGDFCGKNQALDGRSPPSPIFLAAFPARQGAQAHPVGQICDQRPATPLGDQTAGLRRGKPFALPFRPFRKPLARWLTCSDTPSRCRAGRFRRRAPCHRHRRQEAWEEWCPRPPPPPTLPFWRCLRACARNRPSLGDDPATGVAAGDNRISTRPRLIRQQQAPYCDLGCAPAPERSICAVFIFACSGAFPLHPRKAGSRWAHSLSAPLERWIPSGRMARK